MLFLSPALSRLWPTDTLDIGSRVASSRARVDDLFR